MAIGRHQAIAVAQKGMSFGDATQTFTLLTVGDGLVSQMPALIVSTAAGLMVSKCRCRRSRPDKALMGQLSFYPQAILHGVGRDGASSRCCPACPHWPSQVLSAGIGALAWVSYKRKESRGRDRSSGGGAGSAPPISSPSEELILDCARASICCASNQAMRFSAADQRCERPSASLDQIGAPRRQLAQDAGFVMPAVRILDNMQPAAPTGIPHPCQRSGFWARASCSWATCWWMDPKGLPVDLLGTHTTELAARPARDLDFLDVARRSPRSAALPWSIRARC